MVKIKPHKSTGKENSKMNLSAPKDVKKKSSNKKIKASNKKLDSEKFLSLKKLNFTKNKKPNSKNIDGEKFLVNDLELKNFEQFLNESISSKNLSLKEKAKKYFNQFNDLLKGIKFTSEEFNQIMTMGQLRPIIPPKSVINKFKKEMESKNEEISYEDGIKDIQKIKHQKVKLMLLTPAIIGLIIWFKFCTIGFHADVKIGEGDQSQKIYQHALVKGAGNGYVSVDGKKYPVALTQCSGITW